MAPLQPQTQLQPQPAKLPQGTRYATEVEELALAVGAVIGALIMAYVIINGLGSKDLHILGYVLMSICIGVGVVTLYLRSQLSNKVSKSTSLFLNFARSAFSKACPSIDWEEED